MKETTRPDRDSILLEALPPLSPELREALPLTRQIQTTLEDGYYGSSYVVFTDGSCFQRSSSKAAGHGGWASVIKGPRDAKTDSWELHGQLSETTSNRAELCALLAVLVALPDRCRVNVHSDSRYVVDKVNFGCRSTDNTDLWTEVVEVLAGKEIALSATWIHGHNGHRHNERCDRLARGGQKNGSAVGVRRPRGGSRN